MPSFDYLPRCEQAVKLSESYTADAARRLEKAADYADRHHRVFEQAVKFGEIHAAASARRLEKAADYADRHHRVFKEALDQVDRRHRVFEQATKLGLGVTGGPLPPPQFFGGNQGEHRPALAQPSPPHNAERLLLWLLPKASREAEIGDLEEEYRTIAVPKLGEREAQLWYWWQAVRSVLRGWLVKSSIVAAFVGAIEWVRRTFGT